MSGDFNPEQKRYLEGFVTGLQIAKAYLAHRLAAGKFPPFTRWHEIDALRSLIEGEMVG
jgi:hypothetical protein